MEVEGSFFIIIFLLFFVMLCVYVRLDWRIEENIECFDGV